MKIDSNLRPYVGIAVGIVLSVTLFCLGMLVQCNRNPEPVEKEKTVTTVQRDTVTLWRQKTVKVDRPVPVTKTITRVERDTLLTTQILHDTDTVYTPVAVDVPITTSVYSGEKTLSDSTRVEYEATVSGYKPALDSLQFKVQYPERQVFTNTTTVTTSTKRKRWGAGPSLGFGYGLTSRKVDIFVGLSVTYSF